MLEIKKFQNPDAQYGIHPFWFWNGEMDKIEIEHQIAEMANKKVTGFFLCARQGMTVPYLSDQWFEKVNHAIETAEKFGMHVWLYDEYPYPSGMAGGEVTLEHTDAKQFSLVHQVEKTEGGQNVCLEMPWSRVLSAMAVPVTSDTNQLLWEEAIDVRDAIGSIQVEPVYQKTGLTAYNQKRFFTYQPKRVLQWMAPEGKWEIHCFLEQEIEDFKYYGTFVDPCHEEAMATFIESTHEKYAKKIGHHFGKTVKGMFTDEIHLLGRFPWSPRIVSYIQETYGYDIREYLHLLIHQDDRLSAQVRYHYYQAVHLLTRKSYHKQVHDWCEKNGLEYVAEVPSARMSAQVYSHVPGGDSAHEKLGRSLEWILDRYFHSFRANPKMISGLSYQLGRDRALIECFHSVGWSMTLQDAKWMIDRMAAFGINFFNFHAFFYTLDAMVKHDAPPSQFLQNPYWKHYRKLGDYTSRISYLMSEGTPVRRIAVLDPTTSLWAHMGNPYTKFAYTGTDEKEEQRLEILKQHWADICKQLTLHHKDYDHLDPELLQNATVQDGKIEIGKMIYEVLVLPPMSNIEADAWKVIQQFINDGGVVIANGLIPYQDLEDDAFLLTDIQQTFQTDRSVKAFWEDAREGEMSAKASSKHANVYFIPATANQPVTERTEALFNVIDQHIKEDITLETENDAKCFLMQRRTLDEGTDIIFISNQEGEQHQASLTFENANKGLELTALDLETGKSETLSATQKEEGWEIDLHFAPYQSHVIQVEKAKSGTKPSTLKEQSFQLVIDDQEQWEMKPLQENMLRFNTFDLQLDPNQESVKVQAKTFVDQCEDLAKEQSLPVSFTQTFGTPMKANLAYPIDVNYQTSFYVEKLPANSSLVMDRHAITGEFDLLLNGQRIHPDTWKQAFVYDHNNVVADVCSNIKAGKNTLQIKGKVYHDWDGVVDSIYLMGDFGVVFDHERDPIVTVSPKHADTLAGPYPGLPYYAGSISFKRKINLSSLPDTEEFLLQLQELEDFHECAEVFINGQSLGVKAWSPYRWKGQTPMLQEHENVVQVLITNTLAGLLEGKYFDEETHSLKDVRVPAKQVSVLRGDL
ncbi:glycosyl hydrolase [Gracilibacillus sp. YIM 98692]|uniref:glycosyl hydrolase n=1 Tax=Gracilibacillus sp. YIM 98692 TaxID=2663532 RepID=UPI0013CFD19C|nr:glycosyl hydrolase [Gracilibacillus sp. YIM 98692]